MTKEEFAQSIKAKFPQYADIDDLELAERTLAKFPVYRSQIDDKVGFFQGVKEDIGSRVEKVENIVDSPQSLPSKALQFAGQAVGAGLDIAGRGISAVTPDVIEEPITKGIEKGVSSILETKLGQKGIQEFQEFKQNFPETAGNVEALLNIGAVTPIGKAGQVATRQIGKGIQKGVTSAIKGKTALVTKASKLAPVIRNKVGDTAYNKLNQVSRDLLKMSPTQTKNEVKWNKNTPKFLVDEGVVSLIESDGKKLSTQTAADALRSKYIAEAEAFNSVLADSGEYISLDKLSSRAKQSLTQLKAKGTDFDDAVKHVDKEVASFKKNFANKGLVDGDDLLINVADFNDIKSGFWARTSNFNPTLKDKLTSDLNYKMGQVAKELIEETLDDVGVKGMNSRLGDFASALRVLENVEGKTVPGGFFGKQFLGITGTIAGVGGGVTGSIIGSITGRALADLMVNPKTRTIVLTKIVNKLGKTEKGASIIDEATAILKKRGKEREARKLLESGKTILGKEKADTSRLLSQDEAKELLDAMKIKGEPKRIQAPKGDITNPIIVKGKK